MRQVAGCRRPERMRARKRIRTPTFHSPCFVVPQLHISAEQAPLAEVSTRDRAEDSTGDGAWAARVKCSFLGFDCSFSHTSFVP